MRNGNDRKARSGQQNRRAIQQLTGWAQALVRLALEADDPETQARHHREWKSVVGQLSRLRQQS